MCSANIRETVVDYCEFASMVISKTFQSSQHPLPLSHFEQIPDITLFQP